MDCGRRHYLKGEVKMAEISIKFIGAYDKEYALFQVEPMERYIIICPHEEDDPENRIYQVQNNFLCPLKWMEDGLYFEDSDKFLKLEMEAEKVIEKYKDNIFAQMEELEDPDPEMKEYMDEILKEAASKKDAILRW